MSALLREALRHVQAGAPLSRGESRAVFADALRGGDEEARLVLAGLVASLAQRGEGVDEIAGAADALRDAMTPFEHPFPEAVDTCGTGGDGLETFNLSTAAALVAAAAGARVVKHGGRSVSSRCGSADLLEALGLPLELPPDGARAVLEEVGITFLFAPAYHPAMRHAAPVRRALGVRTLFNLLGPLCNPGRVKRQLLGVGEARRLEDFRAVLEESGTERGYVVHGAGGADELTLAGENRVLALGSAGPEHFDAATLGLAEHGTESLRGGDAGTNRALLATVLDPASREDRPLVQAVLLNAAAALVAAGVEERAADALERAREARAAGRARGTLDRWIATARRFSRPASSAAEVHP